MTSTIHINVQNANAAAKASTSATKPNNAHAAVTPASAIAMPSVKRPVVSMLDLALFLTILVAALYYLYIKLWKNRGQCSKGGCSSCPSACKSQRRQ